MSGEALVTKGWRETRNFNGRILEATKRDPLAGERTNPWGRQWKGSFKHRGGDGALAKFACNSRDAWRQKSGTFLRGPKEGGGGKWTSLKKETQERRREYWNPPHWVTIR